MIVFVVSQDKGKGSQQIPFWVTGDLTSLLHSLQLHSKHFCQQCCSSKVPLLCSAFSKHGRLSRLCVVLFCSVPHSANTDGSPDCVLFCSVLLVFAPYVKIQDFRQVVVWGSQLYGEPYSALVKGNAFEIHIVTVVCVACTCVRHTLRFWNVRWHCRPAM